MDWGFIVQTLGGAAILVAAAAWLFRSLIGQFLSKDLERFKSDLKSQNEREIESLKSDLKIEAEKKTLQFSTLHSKRAEIMADLYEKLFDTLTLIQGLRFEYEYREIREDLDRKYRRGHRAEWQIEPGIDTLLPEEEQKIEALRTSMNELFLFYKKHLIYFPSEICEEIDRFLTLSSYTRSNYQNIALKDAEDNLLVNPVVKEMWDKAYDATPKILQTLETKFRGILGVK